MPALHGSKARMYIGGFDMTGFMRGASAPSTADVADSSVWGMTSKRYTPSDRQDMQINGDGVWEQLAVGLGGPDELLTAALGQANGAVVTWLPQGEGLGNRGRALGGIETSWEIDSPMDDITGFTFEAMASSGGVARGRSLQPFTGTLPITVTGNGTGVDDLGAAGTSTKGIGAALHVINKGGGAGTLTVVVQHSPDGSAWTDIITFAGVTVKNVAQYLEATGTVQRHLRARWTVTGGTWDISVVAGRK